ncbi:adenylate kinase family protein [Candidatus Nanohalobium constans]|uniref:Putative adenylate kinase n=1 Tax=Candidatus Nanohalobium constans TaxID=2565781 RepID=A0A5Q0UH71_9ARCH|nr:AAA family ATPase [Candidatus Nanohalobium constans]QGA80259.1 adenylate kinase [Candidatus Nanohalobium constans]
MKITLTGTPGTGKTTVSDKLAERGYDVVHLTRYFEENDIGEEKAGEREVRIGQMVDSLESEEFPEDVVIEGHLSHHFPSDACVVLRCRPDMLEERLSSRDYSDRKIEENVEAEKLDIVLSEAVQNQETVIEVDTTGKTVESTIKEILNSLSREESDYGGVDWTEFI